MHNGEAASNASCNPTHLKRNPEGRVQDQRIQVNPHEPFIGIGVRHLVKHVTQYCDFVPHPAHMCGCNHGPAVAPAVAPAHLAKHMWVLAEPCAYNRALHNSIRASINPGQRRLCQHFVLVSVLGYATVPWHVCIQEPHVPLECEFIRPACHKVLKVLQSRHKGVEPHGKATQCKRYTAGYAGHCNDIPCIVASNLNTPMFCQACIMGM